MPKNKVKTKTKINPIAEGTRKLKYFIVDGTNCRKVTYSNNREGKIFIISKNSIDVQKRNKSETTILIFLSHT
jgi:hypothetical protein